MALLGGFTPWAHLRLRDHRPGPKSYPPPGKGIPEKSILHKYPRRPQETTVGPGEYQIPSTVGQCRSTVFGPPGGLGLPEATRAKGERKRGQTAGKAKRSDIPPLPKQYSLAQSPDTPAFSMYCKAQYKQLSSGVGPGEYTIPSSFDPSGKGPHFGQRTKLLTTCDMVPGPGAYNVPRFGDVVPNPKEYITSVHKVLAEESGPGPGSYDDPTTIAARFAPPKLRLYDGPHFGRRYNQLRANWFTGPGPADYGDVSRIMQKRIRCSPVFRPSVQTVPDNKTMRAAVNFAPGPGVYLLPSEFDWDYKKGFSLGPRTFYEPKTAASDVVGPGSYDLGKPPMTSKGFRFAAQPYYPLALAEIPKAAETAANAVGGPGLYYPSLDAVRPSKYKAVAGFGLGQRFADQNDGGPLCYDVKPPESTRGTVFFRGDYRRSKHLHGWADGGPSYDVMNDTIADNMRKGKGFTFGIRYPARATHQVCRPYDATTNINCEYPDETTWMTKLK
ncbi:hypothetical protein TraAM80_06586 [Trypanosoma rangeli]|uniref:Uncharacterized protein n=1 Tax=Trypanosoma rangeli TaxID=5698 RepID=A0A3R7RG79_TRYRA|nr:uncharacterized protein TraAM80_06586 [Trypanosoma rangeli]RNF02126.1 hypothetical protein TraAM80_06586 [Trypanosoma rangeli]|eukprot:RNF02126.1 hypothetical protein TraAM80_06586 [Trypanosoma rangeli]